MGHKNTTFFQMDRFFLTFSLSLFVLRLNSGSAFSIELNSPRRLLPYVFPLAR